MCETVERCPYDFLFSVPPSDSCMQASMTHFVCSVHDLQCMPAVSEEDRSERVKLRADMIQAAMPCHALLRPESLSSALQVSELCPRSHGRVKHPVIRLRPSWCDLTKVRMGLTWLRGKRG